MRLASWSYDIAPDSWPHLLAVNQGCQYLRRVRT